MLGALIQTAGSANAMLNGLRDPKFKDEMSILKGHIVSNDASGMDNSSAAMGEILYINGFPGLGVVAIQTLIKRAAYAASDRVGQ